MSCYGSLGREGGDWRDVSPSFVFTFVIFWLTFCVMRVLMNLSFIIKFIYGFKPKLIKTVSQKRSLCFKIYYPHRTKSNGFSLNLNFMLLTENYFFTLP